jgi:CMP-N-acetylneuraminic acid synthetase
MPDVTAMIPVLLGSTRVPDKNILLVDGRVLCSYTIEACRESGVFSDIQLNSEDGVFAGIAAKEGVRFHKRPAEWGGRACQQKTKSRDCAGRRCVTNEHYLYNFMTAGTEAEYVCQVNATSPLLKAETIRAFVEALTSGGYDSLFATEEVRAESFYRGEPVTHSRKYKKPSNEIDPIQVVCWAIAGWRRQAYIDSYDRDDITEDGPVFVGNCGVFPIDEREALDIDTWPTLDVIERFLVARRTGEERVWKYIDGRTIRPCETAG